jgi:hypothetical protein
MATQMRARGERAVELRVTERLTRRDYQRVVPELERRIRQHGRIRVLVDVVELRGADLGALWEDVRFDMRHYDDIERLAVVGEGPWHRWMARLAPPLTAGEVRYFDRARLDAARAWIAA